MAKAKKAAASKTKSDKKNKLIINLGNLPLTDEQRKALLDAVHKTVDNQLEADAAAAQPRGLTREARSETGGSATITATFRNTNPGLSELTATHNGQTKTITQSGTLDLLNVKKGEVIMVQGKSLGKADISIDREADPQSMKAEPGIIAFNFFILS